MFSKPIIQEVETLAKKICFHWNDDIDCVLINLLETYSNAPLKDIFQLIHHIIPMLLKIKYMIIFNTQGKKTRGKLC
jgi:hypothetical protein